MKNTLTALLLPYGFETRQDTLFWGCGSYFSGGATVKVTTEGSMVQVVYHHWFYDQDGECVYDTTTTTACHLSRVWEALPQSVYDWHAYRMRRA